MRPASGSLRGQRVALSLALLGPLPIGFGSTSHAAPPISTPAPCSTDDSLSPAGSDLWVGLIGKRVRLTLDDGDELHGRVVAQSVDELAFARASDERVLAIEKREVTSVHVREPSLAGPSRNVGRRQRAAGGVLVILGSIAASTGTAMLALCPDCLGIHLPLLLPGTAMIGAGVGLLRVGERKRAAYRREWGLARVRPIPSLAVGREGGNVGLMLRF